MEGMGRTESRSISFYTVGLPSQKAESGNTKTKKYLKELAEYHKIEIDVNIEMITKSEASRKTDHILTQYGRMPKA